MAEPVFDEIGRIAIAVADLDAAMSFFSRLLGARAAPVEEVRAFGFRYTPFAAAGFEFELLQPTDPNGVVGKFLSSRGEGVHHVSFFVRDLDAAVKTLDERGIRIAFRYDYPGGETFEGARWREAFIHPRDAGGLLIHLAERTPVS